MNTLLIIDGLECYEENGTAYLKLETVARGLGFTREKDGRSYIMWDRIREHLVEFRYFRTCAEIEQVNDNIDWAKGFIPENVFYRLAMKAKNEVAEAFQAKIADEIIPQIRRTGSYNAYPTLNERDYELEHEKLNVRKAEVLTAVLNVDTLSLQYKNVVSSLITNLIAGEMILPLPKQERRTYSAKEVGERMGVSANKIGRIANANSLKVPEYGEYYRSKSEYSNREVDTWRYYESVFPVIKEILESE